MIKNVERLVPGDVQLFGGVRWEVEAAELQDGMTQVLWRSREERRWTEHEPGTAIIVEEATPAAPIRVRMIKTAAALTPGDQRVGLDAHPYRVVGTGLLGNRIVVEWSNGLATRVRQYDPLDGVLVEAVVSG